MRPYYQALVELNANPSLSVAVKYLNELLTWFSVRLTMEHPARLTKDIDRAWVAYAKRSPEVTLDDGGKGVLTESMFRQCLAQLPIITNIPDGEAMFRGLYRECKWDYDKYVDPVAGADEDIIEFPLW